MLEQILGVILFLLMLPVFLVIVLCMVLEGLINPQSRGPIIYSEVRFTKGNPFNIYKFRTVLHKTINSVGYEDKDIKAVECHEKNQTAVGNVLKKVYMDELPQIINIIKGEMSFVGPRPLAKKYYLHLKNLGNVAKDELKAGWTGPWQSEKGYLKTDEDIVRVENEYLEKMKNLSFVGRFIYKFKIIMKTFRIIGEAKSI